jgi:hypothetical protein
MDEDPVLLFRYSPTLSNDDGSEIGFYGMGAIRRPYLRRARLVDTIRTVGLVLSWIGLIAAGTAYVLTLGSSILFAKAAFTTTEFFTVSPLLYQWLRLTRDLPPLPKELTTLWGRLKSGEIVAARGSRVLATSQFRSPFAVLLSSDVDHDWDHAPDYRLKHVKRAVELGFPAISSQEEAVSNASKSSAVEKLETAETATVREETNNVKHSQTDCLKRLRWQQVVYGVPTLVEAEAFHGDNKQRVELTIRWGRAPLRGKTSFKPGFSGAKQAVIEAIYRQRGRDGETLKIGQNGSDSDKWIKQLVVGRYHDGRTKDYLIGRPHFAFKQTSANSDNPAKGRDPPLMPPGIDERDPHGSAISLGPMAFMASLPWRRTAQIPLGPF